MSYVTGQPAGVQAVLHGERLGHVGHRLVEFLQVTFVLHLQQKGDSVPTRGRLHAAVEFCDGATYLASQRVGVLVGLVNRTLLQVILRSLSLHFLVKLLLVLQLVGRSKQKKKRQRCHQGMTSRIRWRRG